MSIFDKYNSAMDLEGLKEDLKDIRTNGNSGYQGNNDPVPAGNYEVSVEKIEVHENKRRDGLVMSIWFRILEGEYKNRFIFMNQSIMQAFQVHNANEVLKGLTQDIDEDFDIVFEDYDQYNDLGMDIFEAIQGKYDYGLRYSINDKGYGQFEIVETFDA